MKTARVVALDKAARTKLEEMAREPALSSAVRLRAQIVLLAADGLSDTEIASQLNVFRKTAGQWRRRFLERGYQGLLRVAPGRGRFPKITEAIKAKVLRIAATKRSRDGTALTSLELAPLLGISAAAIRKILREARQAQT